MYEEKKFGWRAYKRRFIAIAFVWILAFVMKDRWGPSDMSSAWIMAIVVSTLAWGLGAWENELRYQNLSQIFTENGLHYSFHPHSVHSKGKWTMIAGGGFTTGGIEAKGGEGTLIFPTDLLQTPATNPPKALHLRAAPSKCSIDALPQEVRDYIVNAGFGHLKGPFYFTQTPIVDAGADKEFKDAIIGLSKNEEEIKDLNKQVADKDKVIRNLLAMNEELRDFRRPWWKKFLPSGEKKEEED